MNTSSRVYSYTQRGMATLAILILVGFAVSVAVFGALRFLQGSQSQTTAYHSQTQAQMRAWAGVDMLTKYLNSLEQTEQLEALISALPVKASSGQVQQKITVTQPDPNLVILLYQNEVDDIIHLYAEVSGVSGRDTKAYATSTIETIFAIERGSAPSAASSSCQITKTAVLRGETDLSGGGTEFISGNDLSDIAVEGNLTLGSSSKSALSGCASGNITMTGGGIRDNAFLYAGGDFTINQMSQPSNVRVWARNVNIGNTGSNNFNFIRAGAYFTDVFNGGSKIGTASIGGKLIPSTTSSVIPWVSGTVMPYKGNKFVIQLNNTDSFLVDIDSATINESNGLVTGFTYDVLTGASSLPDTLQFKATGINGGNLTVSTLTANQLWGHAVSSEGWGANYTEVLANGHFRMGTGSIGRLTGGGHFTAIHGGCSAPSNCWNVPTINNPSSIAGQFLVSGYQGTINRPNLNTQVANTSPGLPGIPYCDTRTNPVVAADYKSLANYIFEVVNSKPQLTIKNIELANGAKLDGVYDLLTNDLRQRSGYAFLACGWGNNHCFRDNKLWNMNGISAFPPGVAWFDGAVTIDGVKSNNAVSGINNNILATLISVGKLTLTSSGHGQLIAPNFNVNALCKGAIKPTNLCTSAGELIGEKNLGAPIGNYAIITQDALDVSGWTINGHVMLGRNITTSGAKVIINGGLVAGANDPSGATVGQGGLTVNTQNLTTGQRQTICQVDNNTGAGTAWKVLNEAPIWSRYL